MRNNITGGPSIILHKHHEKDKTHIRGNENKIVQSIKGFDAIALYLHTLMQPMPSDFTVIRRAEKEFRAAGQTLYTNQNRQWLVWVPQSRDIIFETQYNGLEMAPGKRLLRVDGWESANRSVYQFHGHRNRPIIKARPDKECYMVWNVRRRTRLSINVVSAYYHLFRPTSVLCSIKTRAAHSLDAAWTGSMG